MSPRLPATRPRVYLVRHGETEWNAQGRLLSRTDTPLNAAGAAQATGLAGNLADVVWDRAFASPLVRARRTAEIILAARPDRPVLTIDDRLVEMDFGPYEGWTDAELEADPIARNHRHQGPRPDGMEAEAAVERRARAFFADLGTLPGPTLVVGHGRMLRVLIAVCVLGGPVQLADRLRMRNCRPAIVEPGSQPLLLGFNVGSTEDGSAS